MENRMNYKNGFIKGLPICLGYLPVAFTFGFMAVTGGLPEWIAALISMSNVTSSGQFAGTNLIIENASYFEITITTLIINLRYMLMSLALSQKTSDDSSLLNRFIYSFVITDETFAIASMETEPITSSYMYGLITLPYLGWSVGTFLGAFSTGILPNSLKGAMGIALFAMFVSLFIPPAMHSKNVATVVIISILLTCIMKYIPFLSFISSGFRIIIATLLSSSIGTLFCNDESSETINPKEVTGND